MEAQKLTDQNAKGARESMLRSIGQLPGLDKVEALMKSKLSSEAKLLVEIPSYLLELGGKRIRPALVLLTSALLGMREPNQRILDVAAGIELIHMATLLHDDIIDNSPMRRHKTSPFRQYGLANTLLTGDFLLVRAFSLCARLDVFVIDSTEKACVELTEGEILEITLDKGPHTVESSLAIARKKTAALFWLATRCGAHLSSAKLQVTEKLSEFGEHLGMAFQILDDILDVTSDEDLLGKKSGADLRERKPSIVNVLWLQKGGALARTLLSSPTENEDDFVKAALAELRGGDVVEEARNLALEHTRLARNCLEAAESEHGKFDPFARAAFDALIQYSVDRLA